MSRHATKLLEFVLATLAASPVDAQTSAVPVPQADWSQVSWGMAAAAGLALAMSAAVGGVWAFRHRRAAWGVVLIVSALPAFIVVLAAGYRLLAAAGVAAMNDFPVPIAGVVALAAATSAAICFGRLGLRNCRSTGAFAGHHRVNFVLAALLLAIGVAALLKDVDWL